MAEEELEKQMDIEENEDEDENENQEDEHQSEASEFSRKKEGPRFNFIEIMFLVSFNSVGDFLELFSLTGFGMILGLLIDFINGPVTIAYLWLRGINQAIRRNVLAQFIELIPFIDLLPIRTTTIIITIIVTNHPEWIKKIFSYSKLIEKTVEKIKKYTKKS